MYFSPSSTEACSNTTAWDFDVTVFIVVYSCSSTLSFRRPSPGYSETARGWEREPHLFLLIFLSLWWMAFLLCHLSLWKMFCEAEEIVSFHITQICHLYIQQSTVWILGSLSLNLYSILKSTYYSNSKNLNLEIKYHITNLPIFPILSHRCQVSMVLAIM